MHFVAFSPTISFPQKHLPLFAPPSQNIPFRMPNKAPEDKDGSDALNFEFKISTVGFWSLLPMKRPVRPLFGVLLVIVLVATLSSRTAVHRVFVSVDPQSTVLVQDPAASVLNKTLLKYAAIDIGQEQLNQEIQQLLDGNFGTRARHRTFVSWRRFVERDVTDRNIPSTFRSPLYNRYWLDFRKSLQDWARKKRFEPGVMSEMTRLVKHPIDTHNGLAVSDQRYPSCAVVGNSGILLNSDYGELIDSHEVVIRLNNARVESFGAKVGSKTSISFINSNILHACAMRTGCSCHSYGADVPMVMYICQPAHFMDYAVCNLSLKAPLLVTDPRFDMLCARIVKYYSLKLFAEETGKALEEWGPAHEGEYFHYSSGMQALMLALGMCDRVSMFGFGKSATAKHHYHTNQKAELLLHDYEAEYAFYGDLVHGDRPIPFLSDELKIPPVVMYQ